jgi:hypothetical protein
MCTLKQSVSTGSDDMRNINSVLKIVDKVQFHHFQSLYLAGCQEDNTPCALEKKGLIMHR